MTAQQKVLAAPKLKEAPKGVLKLSGFEGPAHGEVEYASATVGDVVEFTVETSTGNSESYKTIVAQPQKPTVVQIRREVFEKNLVPGATAKLRYKVIPVAGNPASSPDLDVKLEK